MAFSVATSSNGSPRYNGFPHPWGQMPSRGLTFSSNAKLQIDADHFGLDKFKRRLIEYLAVARLQALIAQEAEMEQTKAQEVTLKKAIEGPSVARCRRRKSGEPSSR